MRRLHLVWLFAVVPLFAQTQPAPSLAFEVASIKPAGALDPMAIQSGKMRIGMKVDGAICSIGAFSLRDLIRTAYEVKDFQITGPDWLGSPMSAARFNIEATMPEGATEKQVPQMLQALLADRFKLVVHRDSKDQPIYALIVGKGGPKLKPAEPDPAAPETPEAPKKGETVVGQGASQVRMSGNPTDPKGMTIKGGPQGQMRVSMADGKIHMEAAKMSMSALADVATTFAGKPVVDMTELKGDYEVVFDLSIDEMKNIARAMGAGGPGMDGPKAGEASDPSGSSIFASVQQMGLKLESRKAPMTMIVIDHLEKTPTEN
ncbi:MAG TPA: TIGR03435 family protein [Bryobacteraceae bacterium]|nr:TIGR03435 family protein [Bryobacteraceae bacterium]